MKRKFISLITAICTLLSVFTVTAAAEDGITEAHIDGGDTVVTLQNVSAGVLIAAKYGDGDVLTEVKTKDIISDAEEIIIEGINADRVFLWSTLDGAAGAMVPICPAKDVESGIPDNTPTAEPDNTPTAVPDNTPTAKPDNTPTVKPDNTPTAVPDSTPTAVPDSTPTAKPDNTPTAAPDSTPTAEPDSTPTAEPDNTPTAMPTEEAATPSPTAVPTGTPTPKPTPHPTEPPKPTPTAAAKPVFPEVNIPESKAWTVNDTALNEIVIAAADGAAFGPYNGLSGYGDWVNFSNNDVEQLTYTHTDGKTYQFVQRKCWRAGTGGDTRRNFHFKPEAECTVTVAYSTLSVDRPLYICQGGTAEENRLATGTDNFANGKTAVMSAEITDTTKEVYIVGGSSNKEVYGIFVDYKNAKLYGTITHEGGTDTAGSKIVFTDTTDADNKYEVDFADTYAIAVENGKTYNISVVGADGAAIDCLRPVTESVTVNGETRHDVKIADLNAVRVTGDVVVHEYTPNDGTTLDLSKVTLKFTDKTDSTVYTADAIENNRYSVLLKPGKTYTVTAENADGYTLSELSGEYVLPEGETDCFKNILLTENLGAVEFDDTIEVGWDRTYTRINDAVAAIKHMTDRPEGEDGRVTILLDNGVYQEQAVIDADYVTLKAAIEEYKPIVTFYYGIGYRYYSADGDTGADADHAGGGYYNEDLAVQKTKKGNVDRWGPVVHVTGNFFKAENVIFANSFNCQIVQAELDDGVEPSVYGDTSGKPDRTVNGFDPLTTNAVERAAAMAVDGNNYEFKSCEFISSQDTLFTNNVGYFKDCYIEGGTDYIFGGNSVIFDNCTLAWHGYTGRAKGGYITACKTAAKPTAGIPDLQANGYLMRNCTVTKSKYYRHSFEAGGWGRNWGGENCQVVFDGVTIANGAEVPGTWVAMRKAEENKPFSFSILYVNNAKKADGTAVNVSGEVFNPNGTMAANHYSVMSDQSYFGGWTPTYYTPAK